MFIPFIRSFWHDTPGSLKQFTLSTSSSPIRMRGDSGTVSSKLLICTLYKVGDITEPCGTPEGQGCIDDRIPCKLTCCVLLVRKPLIHNQNDLLTFIDANFPNRMLWFTRSKAFRKSINMAWRPFQPHCELFVALYQFCVVTRSAASKSMLIILYFEIRYI